MPSRVRVAGLIGGRAYFGRHILGYLRNVADSAGVLMSRRKKGTTWQDILAAWSLVDKYIEGCKLYVVRERRGIHPSRSLFNQKLLGYRRNKKKKVAKGDQWAVEGIPADGDAFRLWGGDGQVLNNAPQAIVGGVEAEPVGQREERPVRQMARYVDQNGNIHELPR